MIKKIIVWIIAKLYPYTYESITLDKINSKLIRPVPGLIIDGVQYWEFVQIADMPEARRAHYTYLRDEMSMGIDRELLKKFMTELRAANATTDTNRIGSLLYMLEDIITNVTTVESLYNISSLAYFDDKEDLKGYDYDYAMKKIEKFKAFPDKGFFFEKLLHSTLKISGVPLPEDIKLFLRESAVKLNAYQRILSERTESTK